MFRIRRLMGWISRAEGLIDFIETMWELLSPLFKTLTLKHNPSQSVT